jgi:hypothetical protein
VAGRLGPRGRTGRLDVSPDDVIVEPSKMTLKSGHDDVVLRWHRRA